MPDRAARKRAFLADCGWQDAGLAPLAGDASFRRYERVSLPGRTAVLMDAPPGNEDVRPFLKISRHLRGLGLSAPEVLAADTDAGFVLLEDLGEATYTRVLANGRAAEADERALYALAVDVLVHLHRRPPAEVIPAGLAPYDDGRLLAEANLLVEWYLPAVGVVLDDPARRSHEAAWRAAFAVVHRQPRTLVLRDFHVDNLVWLGGRRGVARCGLLDFQDAVAGPAAYDLMSLLEDARRDVAPDLVAAMLARYRRAFPGLDWREFQAGYAVLAAQRHAKVIGIFTRLCRRDGKRQYLVHIPRVWRLLAKALGHPSLTPVAAWFQRFAPADRQETPPCLPAAQ